MGGQESKRMKRRKREKTERERGHAPLSPLPERNTDLQTNNNAFVLMETLCGTVCSCVIHVSDYNDEKITVWNYRMLTDCYIKCGQQNAAIQACEMASMCGKNAVNQVLQECKSDLVLEKTHHRSKHLSNKRKACVVMQCIRVHVHVVCFGLFKPASVMFSLHGYYN